MTSNPDISQRPSPLGGNESPTGLWPSQRTRFGLGLTLLFILLIATGTLLLLTPYATPHIFDEALNQNVPAGEQITFGEALFTATSAVTVTGLTVRDTARGFTPFGQAVIASLIQLGALCIITFGSVLALRISEMISLHANPDQRDTPNGSSRKKLLRYFRFIVLTTITIELIGTAALYPLWDDPEGGVLSFTQRVGMSLFHSMSAFCNAGFDITGHSLADYRYAMLTHAVILPLIVVGGVGLPVLENIFATVRDRLRTRFCRPVSRANRGLTAHTKLVVTTTACLYIYGVVTIGAGQMTPYLHESMQLGVTAHAESPGPLTLSAAGEVLADASFMSVATRTAGFNAIPMDELQPAGRFSTMTLMLIGGSPGSAAGGLKTTVIALLVLSAVATLRQRSRVEAFGLTIPGALIRQATALGLCYLLLVITTALVLCLVEPFTFQSLLFEAVSASTNTGLSLGITPDLTGIGRWVVLLAMFLGRVGLLVLAGRMILAPNADPPSLYPQDVEAPD